MERELAPTLTYHDVAHTRDQVVPAAEKLARHEGFNGEDMMPVSTAAWFHDLGLSLRPVLTMMISGLDAEILQGKSVADAAKQANVKHLVYGSAGIGKPTGVGSWDSKLEVEAHMKALNIQLTILRPMAFMDLMTDKGYYPPVSTWHLMPKLMGESRPMVWISAEDAGIIAAKAFASPEQFIGKDIKLASDLKSIQECRAVYRDVMGKPPSRFPMPIWMFKRFVGDDLLTMWKWLGTSEFEMDTQTARTIHPDALDVEV